MLSSDLAARSSHDSQCVKKVLFFLLLTSVLLASISTTVSAQFGPGKIIYNAGGAHIPKGILAADFDGDSDIDVMTKDWFNDPIIWIANDGNGNFSGLVELPGSGLMGMTSMMAIDYDKDGDQDVVASFHDTKKCLLWTNLGPGNFSSPATIVSNTENIGSLYIIDYDKDGDQDIFVATGYLQSFWLENDRTNNGWLRHDLNYERSGADYFDIVDINNDGVWEIFSVNDSYHTAVLLNGIPVAQGIQISKAVFVKAVDVDRDNDVDLVAAVKNYDGGIIWLENINGSFIPHQIQDSEEFDYNALAVFDYDGDGDEDIFASCWFYCGTDLYENLGAANFKRIPTVSGGGVLEQNLTIADINDDGRTDLVQTDGGFHVVYWNPNNAEQFQGIESNFVVSGSCVDKDFKFTHAARGKNITQWTWDFGDRTPLVTARNPAHRYEREGVYKVQLTVRNDQGQSHTIEKTVEVHGIPEPLNDMLVKFCKSDTTVTLPDNGGKYHWYLSTDPAATPYQTGNEFTLTWSFTTYVALEDQYGCVSPRSTLTGERHYNPLTPTLYGASSYSGPAELVLKAEPWHGHTAETFIWRNEAGEIVNKGEYFKQWFDHTTTLYVQTETLPGCVSFVRPVTAYIYDTPMPPPTFTWADGTQSTTYTYPQATASDKDGNLVACMHWGEGDLKTGNFSIPRSGQNYDFAFVTYNMAGDVLDAKKVITGKQQYHSPNTYLSIDKGNNYYFTTEMRDDSFYFAGVFVAPPTWTSYSFVGKLDANGNYLWHKLIEGGSPRTTITPDFIQFRNSTEAIVYKPDGELVNTNPSNGISTIMAADQKGVEVTVNLDGDGNNSILYVKDHQAKWVKYFVTNGNHARYHAVALDDDGNIIVTGKAEQEKTKDPFLKFGAIAIGNGPNFIAKIDSEGNVLWAKSLADTGTRSLITDKHNNIFLATKTLTLTYEESNTIVSDVYTLMKFDAEGTFQWTKLIGVPGKIYAVDGIVPDNEGNVAVFGYFQNQITLDDITINSATNAPNSSNNNIFVAKLGEAFKADFKYERACIDQTTKFMDWSQTTGNSTVTEWSWSFGNGMTSIVQHPTVTYADPGIYVVTLEIKNSLGATATITKEITVNDVSIQPLLMIAPDKEAACKEEIVNYEASAVGVALPIYTWYIDDQLKQEYSGTSSISLVNTDERKITVKVSSADQCLNSLALEKSITSVPYTDAPRPSRPKVLSTFALCEGESVTLTSKEVYPIYVWSNGHTAQSQVVSESGTYTLQVGTSMSCLSEPSAPVDVSFVDLPVATISYSNNQLIASPGARYIWTLNDEPLAVFTDRITLDEPGVYRVEVFNEAGCSSLSEPMVITDIEEGITADIIASPNPVSGKLSIISSQPVQQIFIYDSRGRKVFTTSSDIRDIQMDGYASGLYTLVIHSARRIATRRVMVVH